MQLRSKELVTGRRGACHEQSELRCLANEGSYGQFERNRFRQ